MNVAQHSLTKESVSLAFHTGLDFYLSCKSFWTKHVLENDDNHILIDVRPVNEFAICSLSNAKSILFRRIT